ncbi:WGR domain-containing protein [Croceicoccus hydrothermalis]|uniref:WGR domain-containing protein n=1 Tax=Croceicoccus hydrothermalis TaxID=2867964 RepID=UPI0023BA815A|nr:WGR domain-containing protein [Croceicoccus hydrothermalis]
MDDRDEYQEHWRAQDPERNIAREYHLSVSMDLFGWTIVERQWGRIGSVGQRRHLKVCAPDNDLADIMRTSAN